VTLSLGGHAIRLADPMIRSSLISTVDYGKIQLTVDLGGAEYFLKASQRKKLGALIGAK
jgi:hypothetical protein